MRIFDEIIEKWNIVYAIIFAVGTGLLVDIWSGVATVVLFMIGLGLLISPSIKKFVRYLDS